MIVRTRYKPHSSNSYRAKLDRVDSIPMLHSCVLCVERFIAVLRHFLGNFLFAMLPSVLRCTPICPGLGISNRPPHCRYHYPHPPRHPLLLQPMLFPSSLQSRESTTNQYKEAFYEQDGELAMSIQSPPPKEASLLPTSLNPKLLE